MTDIAAPDYLAPALHGEYRHLTAALTAPARARDAEVIAKALHAGYLRGRVDAIAELLTTSQVAADLGVSAAHLLRTARALGVGWDVDGRTVLFRPEDVAALRARPTPGGTRPRAGRKPVAGGAS